MFCLAIVHIMIALILLNYSRRSFLMRERPFFKSFTDDDSLIPFPVNSLTKRNRDRKNVQTKYQPVMIEIIM